VRKSINSRLPRARVNTSLVCARGQARGTQLALRARSHDPVQSLSFHARQQERNKAAGLQAPQQHRHPAVVQARFEDQPSVGRPRALGPLELLGPEKGRPLQTRKRELPNDSFGIWRQEARPDKLVLGCIQKFSCAPAGASEAREVADVEADKDLQPHGSQAQCQALTHRISISILKFQFLSEIHETCRVGQQERNPRSPRLVRVQDL
jgi:hypothetical protein